MTMTKLSPALVIALAFASHTGLSGQSDQPRTTQSFTATTTAILVDVVVRDKSGRPVVDLSADDFAVAEDGVAQQVDSFTRVTRGGGIGVNVAWRIARPDDCRITDAANARPSPRPPRPTKSRRPRSSSATCRRNRSGWRSARRSTTSLRAANRPRASASSPPILGFARCRPIRPTAGWCGRPLRGSSPQERTRRSARPTARTSCRSGGARSREREHMPAAAPPLAEGRPWLLPLERSDDVKPS